MCVCVCVCGVCVFVSLFRFHGISNVVGYLMPITFLFRKTVLFQTFHFSLSTQDNCKEYFYFMLLNFVKQF